VSARLREQVFVYLFVGLFALIAISPIVGTLLVALNERGTPLSGFQLPDGIHLETFKYAWDTAQFSSYLRSSVIVSTAVVIGATFFSILSGYAFGVMRFRGSNVLFFSLLAGMIVPMESVIVPLYYDLRSVHLTDTYWAVILPQIGVNVSFGTFWMRSYFRSVPRSLIEAAAIDGAGTWRTLWRVLIPSGRPAVLTLVVLLFMWSWNEFLLPLVMLSDDRLRTAPLGLAFFAGQHATDRIGMAAAAVIVAAPVVVVFLLLQRDFVRGMIAGSVKA
jgi:raffinose/stachyose/melibiose transport system permease protein